MISKILPANMKFGNYFSSRWWKYPRDLAAQDKCGVR